MALCEISREVSVSDNAFIESGQINSDRSIRIKSLSKRVLRAGWNRDYIQRTFGYV